MRSYGGAAEELRWSSEELRSGCGESEEELIRS
jgi:hypothetical protein